MRSIVVQLLDIWQILGTSQIAEITALVSLAIALHPQQQSPLLKKNKKYPITAS